MATKVKVPMATKVKVPMDFGRENIGSPLHDNLVLKVKEGREVKTNSLILSYNSPVIANLTTVGLHQTFLDMYDFCEDSVNCFIHAAYTGELEKISRNNFREVNKMAHVFEVSWLSERCSKFFGELVNSLTGNDYDGMLYVLDEARYAEKSTKNQVLLVSVFQKFLTLPEQLKGNFIERYLANMNKLENDQLDIILKIAGDNVIILVEFLKKYLTTISSGLDTNTRYLLENMTLVCRNKEENKALDEMFDMLEEKEGMSCTDLKMVLQLHRKCTQFCTTAPLASVNARLEQYKPTTSSGSTLVWTLDLTKLKARTFSPPLYVGNVRWRIACIIKSQYRRTPGNENKRRRIKALCMDIICDPDMNQGENDQWSCHARVTLSVFCRENPENNLIYRRVNRLFCDKKTNPRHPNFVEIQSIEDPANGFVKDDKIELMIEVDTDVPNIQQS